MLAIFIVVMVTSVNDLQKEKQFRDLQAQQKKQQVADVVRNGQQMRVIYEDVVVGDLLLITPGLVLPADGVIVSHCEMRIRRLGLGHHFI